MDIVIKKRIALDFLGEDYKDSYIIVRAISLRDSEELANDATSLEGNPQKSLEWSKKLVQDRLISGEIKEGDKSIPITKENVFDLPLDAFVDIVQILQGNLPPNSEAA